MKKSLLQHCPGRAGIVWLLVLSTAALVAGLWLPVLTVRKIWESNTFTIMGGIQNLYTDRQYFLVAIIFFFSIIFPAAKLIALYAIWLIPMRDESRQRTLHWLSLLGKWSMLDVFVVAVIIVSVKLGVLASANAESGIYYFASSILLAMLATTATSRLSKKNP